MKRFRLIALIAGLIGIMLSLTACGSHAGSGTLIGVRYSDSIASGGKFKGCINPGQRITTTDNVYYLPGPGNQRQDQWQTGNSDADHADLSATSKDGVQFNVVINENFSLSGDCDDLNTFMKTIGLTRDAYFKNDHEYTHGWITAMNYYVSPVVVKRVRTEIAKYNADELWPETKLYDVIGTAVDGPSVGGAQTTIESLVAANTNGNDLYQNFRTDISQITPNSTYQSAIEDRQNAKTQAQTAKFNAKASVAEANAQAKIAKAQAKVTQAEISAYPNVEAYLKAQVIEGGGNPYQPSGTLITQPSQ